MGGECAGSRAGTGRAWGGGCSLAWRGREAWSGGRGGEGRGSGPRGWGWLGSGTQGSPAQPSPACLSLPLPASQALLCGPG